MDNKVIIFSTAILISVFVSALSQLLLKKAATRTYNHWIQLYLNPYVIIAYTIFLGTTVVNVFALKYVPLSLAAILEATAYIYIPIMGHLFLNERISRRSLLGTLVIVLGIAIFTL